MQGEVARLRDVSDASWFFLKKPSLLNLDIRGKPRVVKRTEEARGGGFGKLRFNPVAAVLSPLDCEYKKAAKELRDFAVTGCFSIFK